MEKITAPYYVQQTRERRQQPKYETLLKLRQFARTYKYMGGLKGLGNVILN